MRHATVVKQAFSFLQTIKESYRARYTYQVFVNDSVINNLSLLPFPLIFKICTLSPSYYEFRANPQGSSKVVPACSRLSMSTFNKQSVVHTIKIDLSQSASRVD